MVLSGYFNSRAVGYHIEYGLFCLCTLLFLFLRLFQFRQILYISKSIFRLDLFLLHLTLVLVSILQILLCLDLYGTNGIFQNKLYNFAFTHTITLMLYLCVFYVIFKMSSKLYLLIVKSVFPNWFIGFYSGYSLAIFICSLSMIFTVIVFYGFSGILSCWYVR